MPPVPVPAKRPAEPARRPPDSALQTRRIVGNQDSLKIASQSQLPDAAGRAGWLRGAIYFAINQGPDGFAVSRWDLMATEPAGGLSRDERTVFEGIVQRAIFESETRYARVIAGTLRTQALRVELSCPLSVLREERSRDLLVFRIGTGLRDQVEATRNIEGYQERDQRAQLREQPLAGRTVEEQLAREKKATREEMVRIRADMQAGLAEQRKVRTAIAEFSAFVAISPEPDAAGWHKPEQYLQSAERMLIANDPRSANMFMDVARGALRDQQRWWDRYKHDSDFGDEVVGPVFWQAFSLLSLGIVDEELFEKSAQEAKKGFDSQLLFIAHHLVDRIGNLVTFGGYEAWKEGVERRIAKSPDDPLWQAMLLAGDDAVRGVFDTMAPLAELQTIAGVPTKDSEGKEIRPDIWAKVGAFFGALMKVAILVGMGQAKLKGRKKAANLEKKAPVKEGEATDRGQGVGREEVQGGGKKTATDEPARSPSEREGKGKKESGAKSTLVPDEYPNVLLKDISLEQFKSLMAELENSTAKGREIAQRIKSGDLHVTFDAQGVTAKAQGLALPKEIHVKWGSSVKETASTTIHEGVHQADPTLSTGPRSQVEATARVYEYEYRAARGLEPLDAAENIYRLVLKDTLAKGGDRAAAFERARNAMIDMMRTDADRYGIEKGPEGKSRGPAKSAPREEKPSEERSKKPRVKRIEAERSLKANEAKLPAELVSKLKALKLPAYLYRQLLAHGEQVARSFVNGGKTERARITDRMKLQEHVDQSLRRDQPLEKPGDYLEEDIPVDDPLFDDLAADPRAKEIIDRASEPSGTFEKGEARDIGILEERAEISKQASVLRASGFPEIFHRSQFHLIPWLKGVFQGNNTPDFIALDRAGKRLLVGDATASLRTTIPLEFGKGTRLHFEKTRELAQQLLATAKTRPGLAGFVVWAMDVVRNSDRQMDPVSIGKVPL